jgi:hypothetical protein
MYVGAIPSRPRLSKPENKERIKTMANLPNSLAAIMQLPGAIGVAIVDLESGMSLGQAGGGTLNIEVAAAGNTEVVRAKMNTMRDLGLSDEIEDILLTLQTQYHIIRPLKGKGAAGLFVYVALDKSRANLALSRHKINDIASTLTV